MNWDRQARQGLAPRFKEKTMSFRQRVMAVAVAGALSMAGTAAAMTKAEFKAESERIAGELKAAKVKCDGFRSNARDICIAEANGANNVARAELEARDKDTADARYKVRIAKAEAAYDVARERCDDLSGNAKDVCVKDAKAVRAAAMTDAKVDKTTSNVQHDANREIAEVRREASEDKREANFAAARERCNSYNGDVKDRCVADAKARFNVK